MPWDKGEAHPALRGWLAGHPLVGRGLVPGCGYGHDVRALAASGNDVLGFDISPSAIAGAQKFPPVGSEHYQIGDFFAPLEDWTARFDWIFEHTCFCAIDPSSRAAYASQVIRLLKPGGYFLAIFYRDPGAGRDGPPFGCTLEELDGLFGAHLRLLAEKTNIPTYPGREGGENLRFYQKPPSS